MIEALLQAERLLVHGQVDQAERIYSSAFAQDPNNAIAVVGLARVALERGDERLAYEHARRALEIDPQNDAAVRLEARLAEVFAGRAEQLPDPSPAQPEQPLVQPEREEPTPRPSETAVFTRNPSMAEHQRMDESRSAETPPAFDHLPHAGQPAEAAVEHKGLLRRLFGR